jgi:predicted DCC family thiol-disulfide oxidoreductase YuxK
MTNHKNNSDDRTWVLYDGDCRFCSRLAQYARRLLGSDSFAFESLNTPWVAQRLQREDGVPPSEMILLTPNGRYLGGPDAVRYLLAYIPGGRPLHWMSSLPVLRPLLDAGYRTFARNRYCLNGACALPTDDRGTRRLAAMLWVLPLLAASCLAVFAPALPSWGFMWLLAFTVFLVSKGVTASHALRTITHVRMPRLIAYWLAWPGMDARGFMNSTGCTPPPLFANVSETPS